MEIKDENICLVHLLRNSNKENNNILRCQKKIFSAGKCAGKVTNVTKNEI